MKAVVFDKRLRTIDDRPKPVPAAGEALIRVHLAGICGTDIEITKGYSDFRGVPGHEFTGIVESAPDKWKDLEGKRVVGEINIGCGACELCARGRKNHCLRRKVLGIVEKDGAFAEYVTLPAENLHVVPDAVSDEEAVFTEPLAAALRITEQIDLGAEEKVLVMGDGKLGLLIALVLGERCRNLTLAGKHAEKLMIASSSGIATVFIDDVESGPVYDVVIDATGSPTGLERAMSVVRPEGMIVMKTTIADPVPVDLSRLVVNEVTIRGSRCGPFQPALDLLARKKIDIGPLLAGRFPFTQVEEAFRAASEPGALKVLIDFRIS